eukprot:788181_1
MATLILIFLFCFLFVIGSIIVIILRSKTMTPLPDEHHVEQATTVATQTVHILKPRSLSKEEPQNPDSSPKAETHSYYIQKMPTDDFVGQLNVVSSAVSNLVNQQIGTYVHQIIEKDYETSHRDSINCLMFVCSLLLWFTPLVHSQSIDPTSITDQICISGSVLHYLNGIYNYSSWDSTKNGSIYYNSQTNQYLYPWVYSSDHKFYDISSDPTRDAVSSHCRLPITSQTILNPSDCFSGWTSWDGSQWVNDEDLRLVNCNDICVSGNDHSALDGTYKWLHFNRTTRTSVY